MAGYNEKTDYDFTRFRSKNGNVRYDPYSSAAVVLEPDPYYEDNVPEAEQRTQQSPKNAERRQPAKAGQVNVLKVLCVTVLIISMCSALLYGRVKNDQLVSKITQAETDLKRANSENTRLQMAITAGLSYDKIEDLARNKLGMVQLESSQITYFETTNGDKVIVKKDK